MGWIASSLNGPGDAGRSRHTLLVAAGLVAIVLLFAGMFELPRRQREAGKLVSHTMSVIEAASLLEAHFERAVSEGRAYLNSGFPDDRALADAAGAQVKDDVARLRALTRDNEAAQTVLDRLAMEIDARIAVLRGIMANRDAGDEEALHKRLQLRAGSPLNTEIQADIESIRTAERQRLAIRQAAARSAMIATVAGLIVTAVIAAASILSVLALSLDRRRRAAHLLQERRTLALLRTILATTPGHIYAKDAEGRMIAANTAVLEFVGKSWAELEGRTDREFLDDQAEAEAIIANDRRVMAEGTTQTLEERVGKDGESPRIWLSTKTPMRDSDGAIVGMVGMSVDITLRKRAEEQLRAFNAMLEARVNSSATELTATAARERAYFNNAPVGMTVMRVLDGDQFVLEDLNPASHALLDGSPEGAIGRTVWDLAPEATARDVQQKMEACVATRQPVHYTASREIRGRTRLLNVVLAPIPDETGAPRFVLACVDDVTERSRLEAALRQGQKMEAIGGLAAGVAHDFNNILQAIIGGLDLVIEEASTDAPARDFATIALNAAMRGSQLTHHLLSFARKQALYPQTVDLASFLPEIENLLARTLGPHIAIDLRVQQAPRALADPGELETALLNLAINAAHAMPGGGRLTIEAHELSTKERSWVRIAVTDTGAGMDEATMAQAVEPFFTTKGLNGTGLGLSMVQGFAEQSGGTLRIRSMPGRGTAVELRLPAAATAARPERPAAPAALRPAARVLLVDDSTDVLVTVGALLEKTGFDVVRADSGDRALTILAAQGRFDALVSDYAMPGLNGAELIARVRELRPGLPVLVITGYAAVSQARLLAKETAILLKPFTRLELIEALMRVLQDAPDPADAATEAVAMQA
jgi:PAS domain S-box-containing protein